MDPQHQHLRQLFERAIALPAAQREAFLVAQCGADVALRGRLESLLERAADEDFPASPASSHDTPEAMPNQGERPGAVFGNYQLMEQIGEGGFGTVWRAQQHAPIQRPVALKILKLGMDTVEVVARFEQERQALALMDHPNIARVLDAGMTDAGRPYFVMELVSGVPILEYCDAERLDTRARLTLFIDVCHAIQHAHQKGIIHRDIKPSNVLVGTHDGRALPKVIDFGIAKAVDIKLTSSTLFTEHHQIIGTPAYMSPEQADRSGQDIDTRSDVYGLGVLLYEMLTGTTPFDVRELLEQGYDAILRTIREVDPPKPSTRISALGRAADGTAKARSIDAKRLGTLLRGDLDWIVMRCLEKDRARRYESASGLALDIDRYLEGETVLAAPPSAGYRLRKALRRHRGAFVSGALVVLALLAGLVGTLWQARIAADQRDLAREEAANADERARQIAQVAEFQERMLREIDVTDTGVELMQDIRDDYGEALASLPLSPEERESRARTFAEELGRVNATRVATDVVVGTLLVPAVEATEAQFADQPLIDASLRQTLANLYKSMGRFEEARSLQEWVLATRERLLGSSHEDTLASKNDFGDLLDKQGRHVEAEPYLRAAWEGRRSLRGPDDPATIISLGNVGGNYRFQGRYDEALPLLREALETSRRVLGDEHRDTLIRLNVMGFLLVDQNRFEEAEPYWREAYETGRRVLGPDDRDAMVWINNLGGLLGALGRMEESEALYREAAERALQAHGPEHPLTLTARANVGSRLSGTGQYEEAEAILRGTLEVRLRTLGPEHPDSISNMAALGNLLRKAGELDEAEGFLRSNLDALSARFGRAHPRALNGVSLLASLLADKGETTEAESLYQEALAAPRTVWPEAHPDRLVTMNNLAGMWTREERFEEAIALLREALTLRFDASGPEHPETLMVQVNLGRALRENGDLIEAESLLHEAVAGSRRALGDEHPSTLMAVGHYALVLFAQEQPSLAEPHFRESVIGLEARLGRDHPTTVTIRSRLARNLLALARFEEAESEFLEVERVLSATPGDSEEKLRSSAEDLIALYEAWERADPGHGHGAKAEAWRGR